MKPELREFIIKNDPTYQFDDAYRRYAFDGVSIEDEQIKIALKRPEGFAIRYVFKVSNRYLYVWRADPEPGSRFDYIYRYWIQARQSRRERDRASSAPISLSCAPMEHCSGSTKDSLAISRQAWL